MVAFLLTLSTYILLLSIMKQKNIKVIDMKNDKYLICDEIICL